MDKAERMEKLLRYLSTPIDGFINIPTGTLHAIGKGVLTYNISRNADLTLRLYDYDRIDPSTHKKERFNRRKFLRMSIFRIRD